MSNDQSVTRVAILGSTGSIGTQALEIIRQNSDHFEVVGLSSSGNNPDLFAQQIIEFRPSLVGISKGTAAQDVQMRILAAAKAKGFADGDFSIPELSIGPDAAATIASMSADVVLNAISGAAGLVPTLSALKSGSKLALANKESLIIGGDLVKSMAKPGQIIPVDSEHVALAQCLLAGKHNEVRKLILTASGGPFRGQSKESLSTVTVEEALKHPTWSMGPLVTINSATMINKGLELIEAHLLFDIPFEQIDVVIHPQSVVHSMVEFIDGSTILQASPPDMRIPIAWGLNAPTRIPDAAPSCDWSGEANWQFFPLDNELFPAVATARVAGNAGGTAPAVFNGADEAAVELFLARELEFGGIVPLIAQVLLEHLDNDHMSGSGLTLENVQAADSWSRSRVVDLVRSR
jgi:1-deoxy-D-xylulose-5-phosphate reductoisomerase